MLEGLHFAVLLEENTNSTEFDYVRLRLKEAGAKVTIIGLDRLDYRLEDQSRGHADVTISDLGEQSFDGVVIPGGVGPEKLRQNKAIIDLVKACYNQGKLCAAICHGQQVLISAGLMRGVYATAAWSMQDDLRVVGAIVPDGERSIRDRNIVTAMFPQDLPEFFRLIFATLADQTSRQLPSGYPKRLSGQTWGIVIDNASDAVQVNYLKLRIQEEGGTVLLLGRNEGKEIKLSSPAWEWGELGWQTQVDLALPNPGVISSCDTDASLNSLAVHFQQLDGLLLPGGLATWMIRGHQGLKQLIQDMNTAKKPIGAIERGPKLLFLTGVLDGRTITCSPQMRDDVLQSVIPINYIDAPVALDGNLITCRGTEDLPNFMQTIISKFGTTIQ